MITHPVVIGGTAITARSTLHIRRSRGDSENERDNGKNSLEEHDRRSVYNRK